MITRSSGIIKEFTVKQMNVIALKLHSNDVQFLRININSRTRNQKFKDKNAKVYAIILQGSYLVLDGDYGSLTKLTYKSIKEAKRDLKIRKNNIEMDINSIKTYIRNNINMQNHSKQELQEKIIQAMKSKLYEIDLVLESPNFKGIPKPKSKEWKTT